MDQWCAIGKGGVSVAVETRALPLPREQLVQLYRQMWAIRHFDTQVIKLFMEGLIRGSTHAYIGMEAVAVGACATLGADDYITSTHRGHGHCIAKGGQLDLMMAELLGKATGYCKGKGGSMHIADLDVGILGANGIVGGGIGIATGAGASIRLRQSGQVVVCFFGDGGLVQGVLHEAMNLASLWKLPVIYLCEMNQYALATPISQEFGIPDPAAWARSYGMSAERVNGQDVLAVYAAAAAAVERARRLEGPSFLACDTYRYAGHNVGDPEEYRSKDEVAEWREQDPIARFGALLAAHGVLDEAAAAAVAAEVEAEIDDAVAFARESPEPDEASLFEDVYA
jgi:TPP-dependent pyruvate/acetoin dehydrogenase alpha subunit